MQADQIIQEALRLHTAGHLQEAESLYRTVLSQLPRHPDALHLLGVLAGQCGRLDDAIGLVSKAVEVRPDFVDAYKNLGRLFADKGDNGRSLLTYLKVTQLAPGDPTGWFALGLCHRKANNALLATQALTRAVQLAPQFAEAVSELGNSLRAEGRLEEAIRAHQRAIELRPTSAAAFNNLGNALKDSDRLDEAINAYTQAVHLDPSQALFQINLGHALGLKRSFPDALSAYDWALRLLPGSIEAHCGRAQALTELLRFEEALAANECALKLGPDDLRALKSSADTYAELNEAEKAAYYYRRVLEIEPGSSTNLKGLAAALRALGKFDEADRCLREALRIDPSDTKIYGLLATLGREPAELEIGRLTALLARADLAPLERATAGFALGKFLDDSNNFDEAFARYAEANSLYKQTLAAEGHQFDRLTLQRAVDDMVSVFTQAFFSNRAEWGEPDELPVFIVGMPRSGTTLVEQIIASHTRVHGAGELPDMPNYAATLAQGQAGPAATTWAREEISYFAKKHLSQLRSLDPAAARVVDKTPANILNLGLIATMFPKSRVIFCRRDPRDNCLSCYFQLFKRESLLFSYDLEDCATQYLEQERLRDHWLRALPLRMLTVHYEELVADLEGQSRRLIDFLGLDWEPACLSFHETERTVSTASVWQVRQPLYTSSVGRWRHYEKHLGRLLGRLGM